MSTGEKRSIQVYGKVEGLTKMQDIAGILKKEIKGRERLNTKE